MRELAADDRIRKKSGIAGGNCTNTRRDLKVILHIRCATEIRAGRQLPHPRHWVILATLVGVSQKG